MLGIEQSLIAIEALQQNCELDYQDLKAIDLNPEFFKTLSNQRIMNSFLFNFSKYQDKIGAKLFRQILFELREIDNFALPMKDILHLLEKLGIIDSELTWEKIREYVKKHNLK